MERFQSIVLILLLYCMFVFRAISEIPFIKNRNRKQNNLIILSHYRGLKTSGHQ